MIIRSAMRRAGFALVAALLMGITQTAAAQTIKAYGPGGPAPAMKEVAALFEKEKGIKVEITAGPTGNWLAQSKQDAHIIFSGSENMMFGFLAALDGQIDAASVEPLYLRPAAILVRKGNPKGIKGIRDLVRPGLRVIVTEGAGQTGMWEDVAGRSGDVALLKGLRSNIAEVAPNSGVALKSWREKPELEAWLIWNHWQIANADVADQVAVEPDLVIWRPMSVAITHRGNDLDAAKRFRTFLVSEPAITIFKKWGWTR